MKIDLNISTVGAELFHDEANSMMEYITMCLDSTKEVEQWYVRHNYFIVLYHMLHVSTYMQVILRPSFTGKSIKCYTCWDPIMLTDEIPTCVAFYGLTCKIWPEDDLYIGRNM